MSEVDREAQDMLLEDMALHQQRSGREVTAEANQRLLGPELERLRNMQADMPGAPIATEAPAGELRMLTAPIDAPVGKTIERKQLGGRGYLMSREDDRPLLRRATAEEAWFLGHALPRVELLMALPETGLLGAASWRDRVLAVMATKTQAAAWKAAAESPKELAASRHQLAKHQALLKRMGLETVSQLTPAFARAKAAELEQQYLNELLAILEESNALGFGDWKADPEKKVTTSG